MAQKTLTIFLTAGPYTGEPTSTAVSLAGAALEAGPPKPCPRTCGQAEARVSSPSINSIGSLGVVWTPGVMPGLLLTGADPVYAAIYQFVVLAAIYAAAGLSALATAHLVRCRIFSLAE